MLKKDPSKRPTAHEVLTRVTGYDLADARPGKQPVFGRCCATSLVSDQQREEEAAPMHRKIRILGEELRDSRANERGLRQQVLDMQTRHKESQDLLRAEHEQFRSSAEVAKQQMTNMLGEEHWRSAYALRDQASRFTSEIKQLTREKKDENERQRRELNLAQKELALLRQESESQQTLQTTPSIKSNGKSAVMDYQPNASRAGVPSGSTTSQSHILAVSPFAKQRQMDTYHYSSSEDGEGYYLDENHTLRLGAPTPATRTTSPEGYQGPQRTTTPIAGLFAQKDSGLGYYYTSSEEDMRMKKKVSATKKDTGSQSVADQQQSPQYDTFGHGAIGDTASKSNDSLVAEPGDDKGWHTSSIEPPQRPRKPERERPIAKASKSQRMFDFLRKAVQEPANA